MATATYERSHPEEIGVTPGGVLHIALWVAQLALATAFLMVGTIMLTVPHDQLASVMPWVLGRLGGLLRLVGLCQMAAALGLILPAALRIRPGLTPLAGAGLAALMVGGALTHIVRHEWSSLPPPILLGALAAFVAWGRSGPARIPPRKHRR